jgi:hypothetical protein
MRCMVSQHRGSAAASRGCLLRLLWMSMAAFLAAPAQALEAHDHDALGEVDFRISCSSAAQDQFNRALALLHHMTYPQARAAFEQVISIEPNCAMGHWGVAMTLFQPLWPTRPNAAALRRGWNEAQKAQSLQTSARENWFIEAAQAFFAEPESSDYWPRIRRWEQASQQAYAALPGDTEAAVFYALAHLATTPADTITRTHADAAATILVKIYERHPDHPGVMHYLVHANDVPGREHELLNVTRKYEQIAPNNPHALHMPTHIYTRLGDWDAVISGNLRAAEAALAHPAGEHGEFVWDEFAHAIEYLVYAYLQQGADAAAATQLQRLHETSRLEPTFKTAFHLASTQARFALERRAWAEAVQIMPRSPAALDWDRFMWAEAIAWFARGLGAAHLGKQSDVQPAIQRLEALEAGARQTNETLFARNIQLLRLELMAWSAHEQGHQARSVELMRAAAALERKTPKHAVTPGPTLPAAELLGDLYAELRNPAAALAAYRASLQQYPRRFNSVLGAARSARQQGDASAARQYYAELVQIATQSSRRDDIDEARRNLRSEP